MAGELLEFDEGTIGIALNLESTIGIALNLESTIGIALNLENDNVDNWYCIKFRK